MEMRKRLGNRGEEIAVKYLLKKGYYILDRNFYTRWGELDIICSDSDNSVIFVEVKTRRSTKYGFPEEAITLGKQQKIKKAALIYLSSKKGLFKEIRFDVVAILVDDRKYEVNHIEEAF